VFEINTWVWLADLSEKYGDFVELGSVPSAEWDAFAEFGFDAVWLMGVWERSPLGIGIANHNQRLLEDFGRTLPDFHPLDNVGSPYCVRKYVVDELLGGPAGLAIAREELARRGMRLLLDFVPNHVAPDHRWVADHPEYFIAGTAGDLQADPAAYRSIGGRIFACGRDPYFAPWQDVLQLNAFHPGLRQAIKETLSGIAGQCDGLRCDMAMLVLNPIFERTWGARAGQRPQAEYWTDLISAIKSANPGFLFMAEAYWDLEWELQRQGFDFCYDKGLYDRLEQSNPGSVRLHLGAELGYQTRLVRFIENHDESRAAAIFSPEQEQAAAVVTATLPGARLFHEGQFEGRRVKLPVFLGRRPIEPTNHHLQDFYKKLTRVIMNPVFHVGEWRLCEPAGPSQQNLLAWSWVKNDDRCLVVVNLSGSPAQARIPVPWNDVEGETWRLLDTLSGTAYDRTGDELHNSGLYVELGPWDYHLLECQRIGKKLIAFAA
jgi:glycosidase